MTNLHPGVSIHNSSVIDEPCSIGQGTKIWHFCHVMAHTTIGANCSLGQNVFVSSYVELGSNVKIQNNVSLYSGVICEDDVFLGPSVVFTNIKNPRSEINRKDEFDRTLIKRGSTIGANATILCKIEIGRYAFVGAGSTVTRSIPDYALVVGTPAHQIGWACKCGCRLLEIPQKIFHCPTCTRRYTLQDEILVIIS